MGRPFRELRNVGRVRALSVLARKERLRQEQDDRINAMLGGEAVSEAEEVTYDNTTSGLTATDVQAALDELQVSGSWTPALEFGGASTGIAYSGQDGHYYRIGAVVIVSATIVLSSKGTATGNAGITGLPVAAGDYLADTTFEGGGLCYVATNMTGLAGVISLGVIGSELVPYESGGSGVTRLTDAEFTNSSSLRIIAAYFA